MSNIPQARFQHSQDENPYVTFSTQIKGVSRVLDHVWDFTAQNDNIREVRFTAIPDEHRINVQWTVFNLYQNLKEKDLASHVTVSKLARYANALSAIIRFWGKSDFSLLSTNNSWREFKQSLNGQYSIGGLEQFVTIVNQMDKVGIVNRRTKIEEFRSLAKDHNRKQHIALPPIMHAHLLENILGTIDKYHSHRNEISAVMSEALEFRDTCREEWKHKIKRYKNPELSFNILIQKLLKNQVQHNIPNFDFDFTGHWANNILKDCIMAVVLFSGCRKSEALSMNKDSYSVIQDVSILKGLSSKGNRGVPITETWVTHPIVEKALELASDITEYSRVFHKNYLDEAQLDGAISKDFYDRAVRELDSAFITAKTPEYRKNTIRRSYLMSINKMINVDILGIVDKENVREFDLLNPTWLGELKVNGAFPQLSLHALRRSFAVFMIRNKLGNLQTIKYQYKHKNINMSGWYANNAKLARMENILLDKELFQLVDMETEELAIEAFDDIYNHSEALSGGGGDRIAKEKEDKLQRGERIVMSRDEIKRLVQNKSLSIVLLPTGGYCTNPTCDRLCSIELFVAKNKPCEHQVFTDKSAKILAVEHKRLIKTFREINEIRDYAYSRILAGYKEKILHIENSLKVHEIDFKPFKDEIENLI